MRQGTSHSSSIGVATLQGLFRVGILRQAPLMVQEEVNRGAQAAHEREMNSLRLFLRYSTCKDILPLQGDTSDPHRTVQECTAAQCFRTRGK